MQPRCIVVLVILVYFTHTNTHTLKENIMNHSVFAPDLDMCPILEKGQQCFKRMHHMPGSQLPQQNCLF